MNLRRKRHALMCSGLWKGHIRNVSGNPAILYNVLGLQCLEVACNSIYDADNSIYTIPININGSNMFNASAHPPITAGGYLSNDGSLVGNPLKIPVIAGKTYTLSRNNSSPRGYDFYYRAICFEDDVGNSIRCDTRFQTNGTIFKGAELQYFASATFIVPDGATILRAGCLPNTSDALNSLCNNVILNYGSEALQYDPYINPQIINIYTPQPSYSSNDIIIINYDNNTAFLIKNVNSDSQNVIDISSYQNWSFNFDMQNTCVLSCDSDFSAHLKVRYYSSVKENS